MPTNYSHFIIPDTQCKPGIRLDYMRWNGQYLVDHFLAKQRPVRAIHLGDHHDMPSLSSYDKGTGRMESRRTRKDIDAGNDGWAAMCEPVEDYQRTHKRTCPPFDPHFLFGNHEDRITRAINQDINTLDGLLSLDMLDHRGWQEHPFLEVVKLDGIMYSHYFKNRGSDRPIGGENIKLRIKKIGGSFVQGHEQTFDYGVIYAYDNRAMMGVVAGANYVHDEDYLGPQGNAHWRGAVVLHNVSNGYGNIMQVDLPYLCQKYENVSFSKYKTRHYN